MNEHNAWVEACVLALLAVNNYSLTKAWELRERLNQEGLLKPGQCEPSEITDILKRVGYDRGEFLTDLVADRVAHFLLTADDEFLRSLIDAEAQGAGAVIAVLTSVKGIGPVVAKNARHLKGMHV